MYESFYGLREKPFQIVPDPEYLYRSEKHDTALTYLEYGLNEQVGLILLTGEVGSGKTTLIQYLLKRLDPKIEAAVIFNSNLSSEEFLRMVLSEFDFGPPSDKTTALNTLNEYLIGLYAEGRKALLVVDEAQNLTPAALEELRMLSNLHDGQHPLLQVVLVGQLELKTRLSHPSMRQVAQRIAVRYHLTGISREDTGRYIAHRLQLTGGRPDLFTDASVDLIFEISRGIPRAINLACQAALVYGFAEEAACISQDIVRKIQTDQLGVGFDQVESASGSIPSIADGSPAGSWNNSIGERLEAIESGLISLQGKLDEHWRAIEQSIASGRDETALAEVTRLWKQERERSQELADRLAIFEKEIVPQSQLSRKKRKRLRELKAKPAVGPAAANANKPRIR